MQSGLLEIVEAMAARDDSNDVANHFLDCQEASVFSSGCCSNSMTAAAYSDSEAVASTFQWVAIKSLRHTQKCERWYVAQA